jgi:hypothetical protein
MRSAGGPGKPRNSSTAINALHSQSARGPTNIHVLARKKSKNNVRNKLFLSETAFHQNKYTTSSHFEKAKPRIKISSLPSATSLCVDPECKGLHLTPHTALPLGYLHNQFIIINSTKKGAGC